MSFSYKTLNSNDITLTSYIANKQWEVNNSTLSQNGITIYMGENLPINKTNPFDPINDSETSNDEYRRLIFNSIKNLYYQNYTSGSLTGRFFHSSSFINYEQSTLTSGSMLAANRNLPIITGSSALGRTGTVFDFDEYDISSSIYDKTGYDPDKGSKITVISIDQNIFGSGLYPNTISLSGSTYNIQDDGEGNLLDINTSTYVGNVFYSQGLIVITNQFYLCILGAPPISVNDYYSYSNTNVLQTLEILSNDFADCGAIDPTSVEIYGDNFPDYTINNGVITITPNQTSLVPGNYQLLYTVASYDNIRSNTSSINLEVTSLPLEITNITFDRLCYGVTGSLEVSFDVNYGVPYYSYSLDEGNTYIGSNDLFNTTFTGSISASSNNVIYVKDSTETIYSASFSSWHRPITYTTTVLKNPCSSTSNDGQIYVEDDGTAVQARINFTGFYQNLPFTFDNLPTGSNTIQARDINECVTSSVVNLEVYTPLTASITQSNATCYGGSNGSISVAFTNVTDTLLVNLLDPDSNLIYSNVNLSSFPNNTVTASNLTTGSYELTLYTLGSNQCQSYNNIFNITSPPTTIIFTATASYINSCSNAILFSAAGGTPPYIYNAVETGTGGLYASDSSSININGLNSGSYSTFIIDSNGCSSTTSNIQIFGRNFAYTGSYCVTASGINTGYISSSGVQQVFTSGPYSGSVVTSSYSNGTNLFGPTLNFTRNFISGTLDAFTICGPPYYDRYYENILSCPIPPINNCFPPTITSVTPLNCDIELWNSEYAITYNSASTNATYTVIEYGFDEFFNNYATHIYTNSSPTILPLNFYDDSGGFSIDPEQPMYFRAYNSCSSGATSSYSDVITTQCDIPDPISYWGTVYYKIINNTAVSLQIRSGFTCGLFTFCNGIQPNNSTLLWQVDDDLYAYNPETGQTFTPGPRSLTITTVGRPNPTTLTTQVAGNDLYKVTITGEEYLNGNVSVECESILEDFNYPTQYFEDGYTTGENQFIYIGSTIWDPFTSSGNYREELRVRTDRDFYPGDVIITCSIDYVTP